MKDILKIQEDIPTTEGSQIEGITQGVTTEETKYFFSFIIFLNVIFN